MSFRSEIAFAGTAPIGAQSGRSAKEEIYVREALALGLDKDDTLIRRLRQKMELLSDAGADALSPTDAELEA